MHLLFDYFTDPVLRAPTIASMFMCLSAALIGVIVFLRKESLIGEALSHASYPGVVLGIMVVGFLFGDQDLPFFTSAAILIGALFSALFGAWMIKLLQEKGKVSQDASLCFILSSFFGIGILFASDVQFSYSYLYKQIQVYFYGQSATMTDIHILIYGILASAVILTIIFFQKEITIVTFDRRFAESVGINARLIDQIFFLTLVLSVIIGIRSVGVVLMSAMLIAPATAARQYTNRLSFLFGLAATFGVLSALFGTILSVESSKILALHYPQDRLVLPSGPMIVLVATSICLISLLFAKERGVLRRFFRSLKFSRECAIENLLKAIWRHGPKDKISFSTLKKVQANSNFYLNYLLSKLCSQGWLVKTADGRYLLTPDGVLRAQHIVRLHRLWEVYLSDYLGVGKEKIHRNAEEMEHIITPEIERELTALLNDPKKDPHHQPIPPMRSFP